MNHRRLHYLCHTKALQLFSWLLCVYVAGFYIAESDTRSVQLQTSGWNTEHKFVIVLSCRVDMIVIVLLFFGGLVREGIIKKIDFFLGNSPKQRTPPTHPYGLGLT